MKYSEMNKEQLLADRSDNVLIQLAELVVVQFRAVKREGVRICRAVYIKDELAVGSCNRQRIYRVDVGRKRAARDNVLR